MAVAYTALGFEESAERRDTWAYRVIEFVTDGEPWLSIHEVHSQDGKPWGYSENPAAVCSETPEGLAWVLDRMREACSKPALRETDFASRQTEAEGRFDPSDTELAAERGYEGDV